MVDHAKHLQAVFRAGISGQPMPQAPPDADSAALHREKADLHRQLAALNDAMAEHYGNLLQE